MQRKKEFVLSKQILHSGTSVGANLAEAKRAISKNDFLAKVYISYKECGETLYWSESLKSVNLLNNNELESLYNDCEEIIKILSATIKMTKEDIE